MMRKIPQEDVKKIELDILIHFADFCDKHQLKYFLTYGTLIGAVRHGGFIPWDDDIDVAMLRSDYEKLCSLLEAESAGENLEWLSLQNGKSELPIGKLVNKKTLACTPENYKLGIWIDVFPIDYYNKSVFVKNMNWRRVHLGKATTKFGFDGKSIVKFILKILFCWKSKRQIAIEMERRAKKVPPSNTVCASVWNFIKVDMDISEYDNPVEVEFEGHMFKTYRNYDNILRRIYGDYMQLPPLSKQKTHGIEAYWI